MSDNSISQREYNKYGNVMSQSITQLIDITTALAHLEHVMKKYKADSYVELPMPVTILPQVIYKRNIEEKKKGDASVKKREAKEEIKNEAVALRKSARMIDKPKPIYDEKEIDKLLEQDHGNESFKVMLA
jgi:hypothetical protein